jgi:hypothetical protein
MERRLAKLEGRKTVEPGEFELFWSAYPKKVGKKDALRAWEKAKDRPLVVDIIQAIDKAKKSPQWMKENGQFIPNPSTWINQGRWDDEPVKIVPPQPKAQVPVPSSWLKQVEHQEYTPPPPEVMALLGRIGKGM